MRSMVGSVYEETIHSPPSASIPAHPAAASSAAACWNADFSSAAHIVAALPAAVFSAVSCAIGEAVSCAITERCFGSADAARWRCLPVQAFIRLRVSSHFWACASSLASAPQPPKSVTHFHSWSRPRPPVSPAQLLSARSPLPTAVWHAYCAPSPRHMQLGGGVGGWRARREHGYEGLAVLRR